MRELNMESYGSVSGRRAYGISDDMVSPQDFEPGFSDWRAISLSPESNKRIVEAIEPSERSPVQVQKYSLDINLPTGVTAIDFDKELRLRLQHLRLDQFPLTSDGYHHIRRLSLRAEQFTRMTMTPIGMVKCAEIYQFGCRPDLQQLVYLCEKIAICLAKRSAANRAIVTHNGIVGGLGRNVDQSFVLRAAANR